MFTTPYATSIIGLTFSFSLSLSHIALPLPALHLFLPSLLPNLPQITALLMSPLPPQPLLPLHLYISARTSLLSQYLLTASYLPPQSLKTSPIHILLPQTLSPILSPIPPLVATISPPPQQPTIANPHLHNCTHTLFPLLSKRPSSNTTHFVNGSKPQLTTSHTALPTICLSLQPFYYPLPLTPSSLLIQSPIYPNPLSIPFSITLSPIKSTFSIKIIFPTQHLKPPLLFLSHLSLPTLPLLPSTSTSISHFPLSTLPPRPSTITTHLTHNLPSPFYIPSPLTTTSLKKCIHPTLQISFLIISSFFPPTILPSCPLPTPLSHCHPSRVNYSCHSSPASISQFPLLPFVMPHIFISCPHVET